MYARLVEKITHTQLEVIANSNQGFLWPHCNSLAGVFLIGIYAGSHSEQTFVVTIFTIPGRHRV